MGTSFKKVSLAALVIFAGSAIWWLYDAKSSEKHAEPSFKGSTRKFTPAARGGPMPALAFVDKDGKELKFEDFGGKIVLVNFWATWCAPCIREMPSLVRLQEKRGGDDFTVIALSQDFRGWAVVTPFLKKHDLSQLPVFVDKGTAIGRALDIKGLPMSIILDRQGHELGRLAGHAEWDSPQALALIDYYRGKKSGD